jgi:hypothetical protein
MQLRPQFNSYNLMHKKNHKYDIKVNKTQRRWLDAPGLAFILSNVNIIATWRLWISEHPLDLLRLIFRLRLHMIYPYMQKMATIK